MDPIVKLTTAIMNNNKERTFKLCASLDIVLREADKELEGKALMKKIFQIWINAAEALLELIVL